jgi:hypothetical protein
MDDGDASKDRYSQLLFIRSTTINPATAANTVINNTKSIPSTNWSPLQFF